jgi:hypothetical protein
VSRYGQQRSWQTWLWVVLTIHALLLPLYGPLVDHHFAERLPYHSHLYLAGHVDHVHLHDVPHSHEHTGNEGTHHRETAGTVSVPVHELVGENLLILSLFLGVWADGVGRPFVVPHLIGLVEGGLRPVDGVYLARPEEPPRVGSYI